MPKWQLLVLIYKSNMREMSEDDAEGRSGRSELNVNFETCDELFLKAPHCAKSFQ